MDDQHLFDGFLAKLDHPEQRARTAQVLAWVRQAYPALAPRIAWNQPMFTDHGTFIIGLSTAKHHLAVALEKAGIDHFDAAIAQAGYKRSKMLMYLPWERAVDFALLAQMIEFNLRDKAHCTTFWRK